MYVLIAIYYSPFFILAIIITTLLARKVSGYWKLVLSASIPPPIATVVVFSGGLWYWGQYIGSGPSGGLGGVHIVMTVMAGAATSFLSIIISLIYGWKRNILSTIKSTVSFVFFSTLILISIVLLVAFFHPFFNLLPSFIRRFIFPILQA